MKKSIFALMTMVSLGAAGLEPGQAHASEMTHGQQNQSCQYNQHTQLQHNQPSHQSQHSNVTSPQLHKLIQLMLLLIHHQVTPNLRPIIAHLVTFQVMTIHLMKAHQVKVHLQYTNNLSHWWNRRVMGENCLT